MQGIRVGRHVIGGTQPCFIIAEIGVNHGGSISIAREMVEAAAASGADAVKFQIVNPSAVFPADDPYFSIFEKLVFTRDEYQELKQQADRLGVAFFASFSDTQGVDILDSLDAPALKIASMHLTNDPLLRIAARTGRSIVLSTGMATLGEVERAIEIIRSAGNDQIVLLHCVANYPTDFEHLNLRVINTLRLAFGVPVGFSDHSLGIVAPIAAVALGASVIEKHFTLDSTHKSLDQAVSLTTREFQEMVDAIRATEKTLGTTEKTILPSEMEKRKQDRLSIVAANNIAAGQVITQDNVALRRPGTGLQPADLDRVIGHQARRFIQKGELLRWDQIS